MHALFRFNSNTPRAALRICRILTLGAALLGADALASQLPPNVSAAHPDLSLAGSGTLRWFGMSIYDASVWTSNGTTAWPVGHDPIALHITYLRDIRARRLVDTTVDEWSRLGVVDEPTASDWAVQLARLWPDVQRGETLTVLVVPGEQAHFYGADRFLGVIDDPAFGPAFLAIWLHPESRDARLRAALTDGGSSQ